ncbi:type III-A CRISPR-associated protein Csm2 [uncultured Methanobrevibacter sp.]|uniref:type III-A CRISPR-associated protein Csm2 n=1 Tax=uncultured Methanobrevibacter sp. TaxID=253161 RepID=UPI00261FA345|nr:type III-A CRISPR-associated protein Csm2 [uncultured Methanobrevibacter sp.]
MAKKSKKEKEEEINKIISMIDGYDKLYEIPVKTYADVGGYADIVAENSDDLKTSQLRKFFAAIRLIEQKENLTWDVVEPQFYLLKPKLAVSAGRKNIPKPFYRLLIKLMEKVDVGSDEEKLKSFNTFIKFFESIVAYHKYYG